MDLEKKAEGFGKESQQIAVLSSHIIFFWTAGDREHETEQNPKSDPACFLLSGSYLYVEWPGVLPPVLPQGKVSLRLLWCHSRARAGWYCETLILNCTEARVLITWASAVGQACCASSEPHASARAAASAHVLEKCVPCEWEGYGPWNFGLNG